MRYYARVGDRELGFRFERRSGVLYAIGDDGSEVRVDLSMIGDGTAFSLLVDGRSLDVLVDRSDGATAVQLDGERIEVAVEDERERAAHAVAGARPVGPREVRAVMPGVVVEVLVEVGQEVAAGETLLVLEAMKMQNPIQAEDPGTIREVAVGQGETVGGGDLLVELE